MLLKNTEIVNTVKRSPEVERQLIIGKIIMLFWRPLHCVLIKR